jgi:phosphoribosylamine-glycine ligase
MQKIITDRRGRYWLEYWGMGCVSPVPFVDDDFIEKVEKTIIGPTIKGIYEEQLEYKGYIFWGDKSER